MYKYLSPKLNLIVVIFLISLFSIQTVKAAEVIKSAAEYGYPPFSIQNTDGTAGGFSVELLQASLKAVDLDVSFYVDSWDKVKTDLAEGKIQVLPLVGRTPEREALYDFTFPYLTFHGNIFVRTGDNRIKSKTDLVGKQILVMKGDNAEEYVRRVNLSNNITTTTTFDEAFQLLASGKYDAVVCQDFLGLQIIKNLKLNNVVAVSGQLEDFAQSFSFAVKKGDSALLAKLNEGLAITIADGTFDNLHTKWFAPLLPVISTPIPVRDLVMYALILLFIMIIISVIILRIQVRRKTKDLQMIKLQLEEKNIILEKSEGLEKNKNIETEKALIEVKKQKEEYERLNKLMIGRELEMIKLKTEIADLKSKIN